MSKEEFLRILRGRITGSMVQSEVEAEISYYSSYIDQLMTSGKTEEEAVEELGDPLLIAKTLGNAMEGGYLDSDYQYDPKTSDFGKKVHLSSESESYSYDQNSYSGNQDNDWSGSSRTYSHSTYQEKSSGKDKQYKRTGGFKDKISNSRLVRGFRDWKRSGRAGGMAANAKSIAILVISLIVAIGCIVLFFVTCFSAGSCILGGLFPAIAVIIILGLIFSLFRRR